MQLPSSQSRTRTGSSSDQDEEEGSRASNEPSTKASTPTPTPSQSSQGQRSQRSRAKRAKQIDDAILDYISRPRPADDFSQKVIFYSSGVTDIYILNFSFLFRNILYFLFFISF